MARRHCKAIGSLIDEYPIMRKYKNDKIPPTVLLISILIFVSLVIFNVFTQGQTNHARSFQSPAFTTYYESEGSNYTCQPTLVSLYQNFVTIPAIDRLPARIGHFADHDTVYGLFQWNIDHVYRRFGTKPTSFPYSSETLNCTIDLVRSDYNFYTSVFSLRICATCSLAPNFPDAVRVCTSWDSNSVKHPGGLNVKLLQQVANNFFEVERSYNRLSLPAYSLPLSAFPPGYNETQEDLHRGTQINQPQVSQVTLILDGMKLIPPDLPRLSRKEIGSSTTIQSPEGMILAKNQSDPVPNTDEADDEDTDDSSSEFVEFLSLGGLVYNVSDLVPTILEAFKATNGGSSAFIIRVPGIGDLKPAARNQNLNSIPEVLQTIFNQTMNGNSLLMDLAARDLQNSIIGVNYLCVETRKEWLPFLKGFAIIAGSSIGVFTALFSMLVLLARKIDSLQKTEGRTGKSEPSSRPSNLTIQEEENIPLAIKITDH